MSDRVPVHPQEERTEWRVVGDVSLSMSLSTREEAEAVLANVTARNKRVWIERRTVTTTAWEAVDV